MKSGLKNTAKGSTEGVLSYTIFILRNPVVLTWVKTKIIKTHGKRIREYEF